MEKELAAAEEKYTALMVECERIKHNLDVLEERLDELDNATKPRKGLVWRLFRGKNEVSSSTNRKPSGSYVFGTTGAR